MLCMEHPQARLDDLDRHLLALLQRDARPPTPELARRPKVARTTVVARIARLEREGVVAGYGVRLGQRMEHAVVRAFCALSVQARGAAAVIRALERMPEVEGPGAVSGEFDYMVQLRCDSPQELDALLDQLGQLEGVRHTQTSMVLSQKIDRRPAEGVSSSHPTRDSS